MTEADPAKSRHDELKAAVEDRDYSRVLAVSEEILKEDASDALALRGRAGAYIALEDESAFRKAIDEAIASKPNGRGLHLLKSVGLRAFEAPSEAKEAA